MEIRTERVPIGGCIDTSFAMKKGRCRWEIISDILKATVAEKKLKKTRIMYKANLDWRNFQRYFDFMLKDGFIAKSNPDECYALTDKGRDFLKRLKDVEEMVT
jgi:predicted transcriptional regulator